MSRLIRLARSPEINWIDVLIAAGLSVLAIAEGSGSDSRDFSPAVLLCTVPLVVRRRWPIPVLVVAIIGFTIAGEATNLAALAGGLIAVLSIGLDEEHPVLGSVAVLGAAAAIAFRFGQGSFTSLPIPPFLSPFLLMGAVFLAGRVIAYRQVQANEARERANQLEREHRTAIQAATEAERRRIARELHDVIAHSVGVMVVQAGAARHVLTDKPDAARESLLAVETSGHEAMAELRRLLGVLNDNGDAAPLSPQPRLEKLDSLVARVREAGLPVELRIEGEMRMLPPGVEVAAYRIVQEALTNALKYAGGAPTKVQIRFAGDSLDIEVIDNGKVRTPTDGIGRGLTGMRERVALFGGTIHTGPGEAGGYIVQAHLPFDSPD